MSLVMIDLIMRRQEVLSRTGCLETEFVAYRLPHSACRKHRRMIPEWRTLYPMRLTVGLIGLVQDIPVQLVVGVGW